MEFVVSFFLFWLSTSHSQVVIKMSSNDTFFIQNDNFSLKHYPHFEVNTWWLFNDKLRARAQEPEKPKMPRSSRIFLKSIFWPLKHDFKTEACNFNLSPWILLEPITILLEIYWNPTKVLMEPVGVLLKTSGVLNWSSAKSLKIASLCWNMLKMSEKTDLRIYSYQDLTFFVVWDIEW